MVSGIFFQGDGQSPDMASSISGMARSGHGNAYVDMNHGPLNSTANSSAPSIGASSLVTDANSALSSGPQLQRSSSINNESYMRLPASPMSFTSNNISGSSVMDGSSIVQQSPHHDNSSHIIKQEPGTSSVHAQKKQRLDMRQDDVLQQQVIHQLLRRQETMQMQAHQNPQLNAIIQQQRLVQQRQQLQQQQNILQSLPHMQRGPLLSQQLRPSQMQVQVVPTPIRRVTDSGICARRLMQYMYHQRHRPPDNSILYWRKFVAEYFASRARKRWCLSMYENVGSQALGAFPQAAMDAWQCDICGSKSGKGFEATHEVLPRLSQIKFDRGIIDELLFLDNPRECRLPSGVMVLEYAKAIQESVYEQLRVIREGQLRITFTPELKIMSWEFCARRHEELFSRRAIAPQVNQLLQVAHKYQSAVNESGTAGVPLQDLQASCNMFMMAGRQLVKNLELHSLNDLGFSKRYVRCLQISEVVNSMKDLIDFSRENKIGPIESLKSYPQQAAAKLQAQKMQEVDQMTTTHSSPPDHSPLNKIMAMHPGLSFNNQTAAGFDNSTPQNTAASNNYQHLLRTSSTSNNDPPQPQNSAPFLTKAPSFSSSSSIPNQQLPPNVSFSQGNQQHLAQHVIQQFLQEMRNSNDNKPNEEQIKNEALAPSSSRSSSSLKLAAANNNNSSSSSSSFTEKSDLLQSLQLPELDQDILREFAESGIQW